MLPERTLLHVVYKPDRGEIHVRFPLPLYSLSFRYGRWRRRVWQRSFHRGLIRLGDGRGELGRAKDVRDKGVVIKTPDSVGTGRLESVCLDQLSDEF